MSFGVHSHTDIMHLPNLQLHDINTVRSKFETRVFTSNGSYAEAFLNQPCTSLEDKISDIGFIEFLFGLCSAFISRQFTNL